MSKAAKKLYAAASVGDVITMNIVLKRVTGDDINYQNDWNFWTALMAAADKGHIDAVNILLALDGIDINAQDKTGTTALMLASQSKCMDVIKALLAHPNLDIDLADKNKRTALNYAAGDEVKDMLRGAGATVFASSPSNKNLHRVRSGKFSSTGSSTKSLSSASSEADLAALMPPSPPAAEQQPRFTLEDCSSQPPTATNNPVETKITKHKSIKSSSKKAEDQVEPKLHSPTPTCTKVSCILS